MQILQLTLFPSTQRFNKEEFVTFVNDTNLSFLISQSMIESFEQVRQIHGLEERRVKSDVMNSIFFTYLKNKLCEEGVITTNDCFDSLAGNVKKHFYAGDYIFLLCKEGCSKNDTQVTRAIETQSCDKIVIQISYVIDSSWNTLLAARYIYAEGGTTLFSYEIPLSYASDVCDINLSTPISSTEVLEPTVSLKITREKIVNE